MSTSEKNFHDTSLSISILIFSKMYPNHLSFFIKHIKTYKFIFIVLCSNSISLYYTHLIISIIENVSIFIEPLTQKHHFVKSPKQVHDSNLDNSWCKLNNQYCSIPIFHTSIINDNTFTLSDIR